MNKLQDYIRNITIEQSVIALSLLLNIILVLALTSFTVDIEKLQDRTIDVSNRLALVEGHVPSLDLNDERMYEYVRKLSINDDVLAQRMEWLESILITIECVDY